MRPARGVPRRPAAAGVAPGPVADLAPQAHVAHLAAAAVRPLVHRGLGDAGVGVRGAYLLGREAPRHAAPYHGGLARGALLGVAYAAPRVGGPGLRRPLRLRRPAEHLRPPERPQPPCSGHPLQRLGHEVGLGHVAARSSGAGSSPLALGVHTNPCRATSSWTVEGDLPRSDAIALQPSLRPSPLSMESPSAFVSPA